MKNFINILIIVIFLGFAVQIVSVVSAHAIINKAKNCADFRSQYLAQYAYDRNPQTWSFLDRDKDSIACESML